MIIIIYSKLYNLNKASEMKKKDVHNEKSDA